MVVPYQGSQIDLSPPWRRISMNDIVKEKVGDVEDDNDYYFGNDGNNFVKMTIDIIGCRWYQQYMIC